MVTEESLSTSSKTGSDISDEDQSNDSVAIFDEECNHNTDLVVSDTIIDANHSFGNIAVTNSNDVHFGNKNIYQGPVTIKQFLYANSSQPHEEDNDNKLAIKDVSFVIRNDNIPNIIRYNDTPELPFESSKVLFKNLESKDEKLTKTQNEETNKCNKWLKKISKQRLVLILSLIAVLIILLTTLLSVILTMNQPNSTNRLTYLESKSPETNAPAEYPVVSDKHKDFIITRSEWHTDTPILNSKTLKYPVPYVIISHTATKNCSNFATCITRLKGIQNYHKNNRNWVDIGYNFLIGGNGDIYEGRGWRYQGDSFYGYDNKSIGIAFIGNFNEILPTKKQIVATKVLLDDALKSGFLTNSYKLFGAKQLHATISPGKYLYEEIKKWPHWSAITPDIE